MGNDTRDRALMSCPTPVALAGMILVGRIPATDPRQLLKSLEACPHGHTRALRIVGCSRPGMWYRDLIGTLVPLVTYWAADKAWCSREPMGFTNIVLYRDAVVEDVSVSDLRYYVFTRPRGEDSA